MDEEQFSRLEAAERVAFERGRQDALATGQDELSSGLYDDLEDYVVGHGPRDRGTIRIALSNATARGHYYGQRLHDEGEG